MVTRVLHEVQGFGLFFAAAMFVGKELLLLS